MIDLHSHVLARVTDAYYEGVVVGTVEGQDGFVVDFGGGAQGMFLRGSLTEITPRMREVVDRLRGEMEVARLKRDYFGFARVFPKNSLAVAVGGQYDVRRA